MDTKTADVIVKIFAVLAVLAGLGMLLAAFGILPGAGLLGVNIPGAGDEAAQAGLGAAGIISIVIGLLYLVVGWGLWTHKNWARITMVVLAWIGLVAGLLSLFGIGAADTAGGAGAIAGTAILSIIIAALEIWFFQFNDATRALFTRERVSRATASPVAGKR